MWKALVVVGLVGCGSTSLEYKATNYADHIRIDYTCPGKILAWKYDTIIGWKPFATEKSPVVMKRGRGDEKVIVKCDNGPDSQWIGTFGITAPKS
jgi:hypothetical protein